MQHEEDTAQTRADVPRRGHALKRSPGSNCKRRVLYPSPGFLSSATWPSMPKKHYNGLNKQINIKLILIITFMQREEDAAQTRADVPRRGRVDQERLLNDVVFPLEEDEE